MTTPTARTNAITPAPRTSGVTPTGRDLRRSSAECRPSITHLAPPVDQSGWKVARHNASVAECDARHSLGSMRAGECTTTPLVLCVVLRSEEHTSELQSRGHIVCRLLLE